MPSRSHCYYEVGVHTKVSVLSDDDDDDDDFNELVSRAELHNICHVH